MDIWINGRESPEIHLCMYGQLTYDNRGKTLFNKWCWENWTATSRRMKLYHCLIPYTKINSRWTKHLNLIPETIKLLEENTGGTYTCTGILFSHKKKMRSCHFQQHGWIL